MSVKAMNWAFGQQLKPGPKLVLLSLADHANDDGICWPGIRTLATKCSIAERTVQGLVKQLAADGLITISQQFYPGTKARKVDMYQLSLSVTPTTSCRGGEKSAGGGGAESAPGGVNDSRGGGADSGHASIEPSEEEPSGKKKETRGGALVVSWRVGFGQVWECYPKKVGKGAAEKAYQKINPDPELLETILQKIHAACRTTQWQKDGGEFIPHLATWLNQRRWEDEYPEPPPAAARSVLEYAMVGKR